MDAVASCGIRPPSFGRNIIIPYPFGRLMSCHYNRSSFKVMMARKTVITFTDLQELDNDDVTAISASDLSKKESKRKKNELKLRKPGDVVKEERRRIIPRKKQSNSFVSVKSKVPKNVTLLEKPEVGKLKPVSRDQTEDSSDEIMMIPKYKEQKSEYEKFLSRPVQVSLLNKPIVLEDKPQKEMPLRVANPFREENQEEPVIKYVKKIKPIELEQQVNIDLRKPSILSSESMILNKEIDLKLEYEQKSNEPEMEIDAENKQREQKMKKLDIEDEQRERIMKKLMELANIDLRRPSGDSKTLNPKPELESNPLGKEIKIDVKADSESDKLIENGKYGTGDLSGSLLAEERKKIDLGLRKPNLIDLKPNLESEPLVDPKPKLEGKSLADPKPKLESKPLVDQKPKLESKSLVYPKPKLEAVDQKAKLKSKSLVYRKSKLESKPLVNDPKPKLESKPLVNDPKPELESKPLVDLKPKLESKPLVNDPKPKLEPKPSTNPKPELESKPLVDQKPKLESKPLMNDPKPELESKSLVDSKPKPETKNLQTLQDVTLQKKPALNVEEIGQGDDVLSEDEEWTRMEQLRDNREKFLVKLTSYNRGGFIATYGSLLGFIPYGNFTIKHKYHAFEAWLKMKKLVDPALYKKFYSDGIYNVKPELGLGTENLIENKIPDEQLNPDSNPDFKDLLNEYEQEKDQFMSSLVGEMLKVRVLTVDQKSKKLIFTEKPTESNIILDKRRAIMARLKVGDIVQCKIEKFAYFGIFVQVEGVTALISHTELKYEGTMDLMSSYSVGQILEARVYRLNFTLGRIFLTTKGIDTDSVDFQSVDSISSFGGSLEETEPNEEWKDVELLISEVEKIEEVKSVQKGSFYLSSGLAPTFQVYMAPMVDDKYRLLARSGNKVQEVLVDASMDMEEMKRAILACTSRVV